MLKAKSFIAVDCGASTLKVAEFALNEAGGLRVNQYVFKSLGMQGAQEATREAALLKALQEALAEKPFGSKSLNVCAPGFHVFSKFVKLPPVDAAKVTQIIKYEAQQNVPFPLEEVVWDYQILGTSNSGELEVLLVAIKTDIVEGLYRCIESAGLRLSLVDVSPAALCNAFRFNYGDLTGCSVLLDIGAKTSTLLFFEKGRVFSRSINIGANSITQDFANEYRLPFAEAEHIKCEKGFVSLGGAYEEPEDPQAAAISKIARQVMTRLHIQMNQTIQFYRGQQGGAAPQRLFLSGGASIMPYTAQFFAEKLNVPVDYFNPFRNIQINPALDLEEVRKVAHSLGEVVGLGLRNLAHCPVELNLMPRSFVQRQEFSQKKPYVLATFFSLVLVVFVLGVLWGKLVEAKRVALDEVLAKLQPLNGAKAELDRNNQTLKQAERDAEKVRMWLENRRMWADILPVFRQCLITAEARSKAELKADTGIWIEQLATVLPGQEQHGSGGSESPPPEVPLPAGGGPAPNPDTNAPPESLITHLVLKVRAVDMTSMDPAGNTTVAFEFLKQLQAQTSLFETNGTNATVFRSGITTESNTFWTEIMVQLKRPIPF